ncbi:MAG: type III pantothenate kinase [Xanthomonadaceae bacterium]|nr:type III pantothenate kinase [Xanthomonadaceae bacterium]
MSAWLFDLGNTRLKFARREGNGAISDLGSIDHHAGEDFSQLPGDVHGDVAWVSAVASPVVRAALLAVLGPRFPRISFARTATRCDGLRIAYDVPARLGVDRFLSLLAARPQGEAILICGIGTALTLDLLDADGLHRGGRIAPSPTLMRESLHARARQLPASGGTYAEFADDTLNALASGCEGAALALIERSRDAAAQLLGSMPRLWLHGGGAPALQARIKAVESRPRLVLEGLARYAALADALSPEIGR